MTNGVNIELIVLLLDAVLAIAIGYGSWRLRSFVREWESFTETVEQHDNLLQGVEGGYGTGLVGAVESHGEEIDDLTTRQREASAHRSNLSRRIDQIIAASKLRREEVAAEHKDDWEDEGRYGSEGDDD